MIQTYEYDSDEARRLEEPAVLPVDYNLTKSEIDGWLYYTFDIQHFLMDEVSLYFSSNRSSFWVNQIKTSYNSSKIGVSSLNDISNKNFIISSFNEISGVEYNLSCYEHWPDNDSGHEFKLHLEMFTNIRLVFKGKVQCAKLHEKSPKDKTRKIKNVSLTPKQIEENGITLNPDDKNIILRANSNDRRVAVIENLRMNYEIESMKMELIPEIIKGKNYHIWTNKDYIWEITCIDSQIIPFSLSFSIEDKNYEYVGKKICKKDKNFEKNVRFNFFNIYLGIL